MFPMNRNGKLNNDYALSAGRRFLRAGIATGIIAVAAFAATHAQSPDFTRDLPTKDRQPNPGLANAAQDQLRKANFDAANAQRKREISDESSRLLKLAAELKAEVDNTSKDTLSLDVIRKAEQIEKLAHSVKQKMKLTTSARPIICSNGACY